MAFRNRQLFQLFFQLFQFVFKGFFVIKTVVQSFAHHVALLVQRLVVGDAVELEEFHQFVVLVAGNEVAVLPIYDFIDLAIPVPSPSANPCTQVWHQVRSNYNSSPKLGAIASWHSNRGVLWTTEAR